MATFNIVCGGPGPHVPASGILGVSDKPPTADVRCPSLSCAPTPDPTAVNAQTLRDKAATALTANAAFLALTSPTNAQTASQVQTLTREVNAVIRLLLNQTDSTTGT